MDEHAHMQAKCISTRTCTHSLQAKYCTCFCSRMHTVPTGRLNLQQKVATGEYRCCLQVHRLEIKHMDRDLDMCIRTQASGLPVCDHNCK